MPISKNDFFWESDKKTNPKNVEIVAAKIIQSQKHSNLDIDLSNEKMGLQGATLLANALKSASGKLSLNLFNNDLDSSCIGILFRALAECKRLTEINIDFTLNNITSKGAVFFVDFLKSQHALTRVNVNFSSNHLGDEGITTISEFLKSKHTPFEFTLNASSNELTNAGTKALTSAIESRKCNHLLNINLQNNIKIKPVLTEIKRVEELIDQHNERIKYNAEIIAELEKTQPKVVAELIFDYFEEELPQSEESDHKLLRDSATFT